jgi:hypothetical protein
MNKKVLKLLYPSIFILGLILMYFQTKIYRNTIIHWLVPFSIIIIVGIIAFFLDFKNYQKTYKDDYSQKSLLFYSLMHYFIGYGFIFCSVFMFINFYFAENKIQKEKIEILSNSSLPGDKYHRNERQPTFKINYKGKIKTLVFNHNFYDEKDLYKSVEFVNRKGYFGFDIIENKILKTENETEYINQTLKK